VRRGGRADGHTPCVVVVTGASSGIGRATAVACARRGDRVVLAGRAEESLRAAEAECVAAGGTTLAVPTDVTDGAAVDALLAAAVARFGRVDAVVHAAAVLAYGRFETVPAAVFDRVVTTLVLGTANVARAALARFAAQGGGHLVLVGSLLGTIAAPYMSSYVTGKWAVHGLARTLRIEARRTPGVEVSLVSPGAVDTPVYAQAASYAGRAGRPPPPVDRPEKVARVIVRTLDRPRRAVSVGPANGLILAGFRTLPPVYDALVLPLMGVFGLSRRRVEPHTGNVFAPRPAADAPSGRWGRQWMRPAVAATLAVGAGAAAHGIRARRRG
jgi:NAD(P)-dependent dehydrogenase (short-subunit alcohol dehydrogenase family)